MAELKREHQREVQRLKEEHAAEMAALREEMEQRLQSAEEGWRRKLLEQAEYIAVLEEQTTSPIQSEREKGSHEQYDQVITQLLQLNASLHEQLHPLRPPYRPAHPVSQSPSPCQPLHKRVSSVYLFND